MALAEPFFFDGYGDSFKILVSVFNDVHGPRTIEGGPPMSGAATAFTRAPADFKGCLRVGVAR